MKTAPVVRDDLALEREIADAVHSVRMGNVQAYATIVKQFQGSITTLCVAILRDRQTAEEVAQDVFVQAYQRLGIFDAQRPMKPWLVKIAYRLAQQRWRMQASEMAHQKAAMLRLQRNHSDQGPASRLLVGEQSEALWQAVYELPVAQRTAVLLYYRENLTIKEVAKAVGVSSGTVKTHLFRAGRSSKPTCDKRDSMKVAYHEL